MLCEDFNSSVQDVIEHVNDIVDEELSIYKQLHELSSTKRKNLVNGDLDNLLKNNKQEEIFVLRLKVLDEARSSCLQTLPINSWDSLDELKSYAENILLSQLMEKFQTLNQATANFYTDVITNGRFWIFTESSAGLYVTRPVKPFIAQVK